MKPVVVASELIANSKQLTEVLLITSVFVFLFWYIKYLWSRRRLYLCSRNMEGPFHLPIIGSSFYFMKNPLDIFGTLISVLEKYPKLARFWHGQNLIIAIMDPEYVHTIVNNPNALGKLNLYNYLGSFTGNGLITAPVDIWRKNRKLLNPSFSKKILDGFKPIFIEESVKFNKSLEIHINNNDEINAEKMVGKTILHTFCRTAMGISLKQEDEIYGERLADVLLITFQRIFQIWYQSDLVFELLPVSKVYRAYKDYLQQFTLKVVQDRQKEVSDEDKYKNELAAIEEKRVKSFLDYIINLVTEGHVNFSEKELKDETVTFLAAGTETTTGAILYTLTTLGLHPEHQKKVYDEIIDAVGTDRDFTPDDIKNFAYLERCIKETMRLFPNVPLFGRSIEQDIKLDDKYMLPRGCDVIILTFMIQRSERFYKDPLKFNPDRFLPEEIAKRHPCTYLPFSFGPRNCIGSQFAMLSMKTFLATVIRSYEVKTLDYKSIEDIELRNDIVLRPKNGFKLAFQKRVVDSN